MPSNRIAVGAAVVGLLAVGAGVVTSGVASILVDAGGQNAMGRTRLAQRELAAKRPAAAVALATVAAARAPMGAETIRTLAQALDTAGDSRRAGAAYGLAGALGWRDTPTQMVLMASAAGAGNAQEAAQRLDALARRKQTLPETYALMRRIMLLPGGSAAVAERLSESPEYRLEFLRDVGSFKPEDMATREALYATLAKTMTPPTRDEVLPYVTYLTDRGDAVRGRALWVRYTAPNADPAQAVLDPGFNALRREDAGYDWLAGSVQGADLTVQPTTDPREATLRAEADGANAGTLLSQRLALRPGAYRFDVRRQVSTVAAGGVLRWTVRCVRGNVLLGDDADVVPTGTGETTVRWGFVVPAQCPVQLLSLETRAIGSMPTTLTASYRAPTIR